jgi:hypothetical protein
MPRHQQVTTCRKSGGPTSKHCGCEHCALSVCSVCGGGEGSLTTDCPGTKVDADRHQELCETNLDYTDTRGWHLMDPGGRRAARFEHTEVPPEPPRADPRAQIAPSVDWAAIDRFEDLKHELARKAIAWVLADRICEDHLAKVTHTKAKVDALMKSTRPQQSPHQLLGQLERENIDFQLSSRRAEAADDEFRQLARRLTDAIEASAPNLPALEAEIERRLKGAP